MEESSNQLHRTLTPPSLSLLNDKTVYLEDLPISTGQCVASLPKKRKRTDSDIGGREKNKAAMHRVKPTGPPYTLLTTWRTSALSTKGNVLYEFRV